MNPGRLQKVIIAAMKQSLKTYLPRIDEMVGFSRFIQKPFDGDKFIAYCGEDDPPELKNTYRKGANTLILIGPEGDFSSQEVDLAKKHGFKPISLGKSRFRTETAGIVACHTINLVNSES